MSLVQIGQPTAKTDSRLPANAFTRWGRCSAADMATYVAMISPSGTADTARVVGCA
jgi:hypothetical protein